MDGSDDTLYSKFIKAFAVSVDLGVQPVYFKNYLWRKNTFFLSRTLNAKLQHFTETGIDTVNPKWCSDYVKVQRFVCDLHPCTTYLFITLDA